MVAMHQRKPWLWGPLSLLGLSLAVTTIVLDQVHKWWMLGVFDIQNKGRVAVLPFLDLEFVKNTGVSSRNSGRDTVWLQAARTFMSSRGV